MAAYFWVGGTGTWSGTGNTQFALTSGGVATLLNPTSADTVTFDANSGTAATVTCTATAVSLSTTINKSDITLLLSGSPTLCATTGTCLLNAGTLNLNNFVLTIGKFDSSNANVRTITTGTGSFTLTGNNATIWATGNATNLTYTSGVPTVNATYSGSVGTRGFSIAGTTDRLNLNITAGTDTITNVTTFIVNNYNFTGFSGTLTNISSIIYGNLTLSSTMTVSAGANTFQFRGSSGTNTITSAGKTMDFPLIFNTAGVVFQLQDALTSGATRTCTLTAGTLDLNGYTLSIGIFSGTGTTARTLAFGSGSMTITGVNATIFDTTTVTNMTITGTPVVNCTGTTGTSAQTRTFIVGNHGEAQSISVNINPGTSAVDIFRLATTNGAFKNVVFSSTFTGTIQIGNSIIIYGNLDVGGATLYLLSASATLVTFGATSGTQNINFRSSQVGTAAVSSTFVFGVTGSTATTYVLTNGFTALSTATIPITFTAGTLNLNNNTLTATTFSSTNSNTRTLAFGTGKLVFTGTNATVWTTATSTGLTMTGTRTVEFTGNGTAGQTRAVSSGSTAAGGTALNAANMYFKAGVDIINLGTATRVYGTLDFTGFSGSTIANTAPQIYGDLVLATGMTVTGGTNTWTFAATTSQTITTNSVTITNPITFDGVGGTWTMQDALTLSSTRALTMTNGTLKLKAGTTNTVGSFATSGTNQKYLQSSTAGTQATISAAGGTNSVSYLTIQDSYAAGGATWLAPFASNNVYGGNNTNWLFGTAYASTIAETSSAADAPSINVNWNMAIAESASGLDAPIGNVNFTLSVTESSSVADANSSALLWNPIDDTQTPNWQNISNPQTPNWQNIDNS